MLVTKLVCVLLKVASLSICSVIIVYGDNDRGWHHTYTHVHNCVVSSALSVLCNVCQVTLCYRIKDHLGSGQFGTVYSGIWNKTGGTESDYEVEDAIEVAVKSMKSGASEEERTKFLQEAAIMGQFKHSYILQILGYITGDPVSRLFSYLIE